MTIKEFKNLSIAERKELVKVIENPSSDYINYMRNGYNYDLKANSLQTWSSIVGVMGSAAGSGLSALGQTLAFQNRPDIAGLKAMQNVGEADITQPMNAPLKVNYPYRDKLRALQAPMLTSIAGLGVNVITSTASATLSHYQREKRTRRLYPCSCLSES